MNSFLYQTSEELISSICKNDSLSYVVFAGISMVHELAGKFGDNVILCSTSGEFTPKGFQDSAITGFSYDPDSVDVVELLYPPAKGLRALQKAYAKVKHNPNAFALLLCDGLSAMEESIITTFFFTEPDFKIIGGSAGDNLKFEATAIYIGSKKVHSAALFFNSRTRTQLIKENLFEPCGKKMLVTDADPIKRTVKTFNNKPASTEYARMLDVSESQLDKSFMSNPLGKSSENDIFIASPMKINSDKSITFYAQIIPNTFVDILELQDHRSIIQNTLNAVQFRPNFVLSINCILRSLYFIENSLWRDVDAELLSICKNQTGFISYGEQYYKNHFNQTMVLLVVE
ncbi:hypothetical protein GH810_06325 [Acetobacterium paludosum]|uniref:FIST domain-containing protein n=1 Tax=Acetobacterium paludosum TaxID=52693 RepID=A0A923I0M0_9FIRM|nr:FIST N-terminal domain-containing protein [Acetobacterium paludosum]MBC3887923.1 hypothetical protein [Acetobacterium paludosum]